MTWIGCEQVTGRETGDWGFARESARRQIRLHFAVAARFPLGEVLFADGAIAELVWQHLSHCWQAIERRVCRQYLAGGGGLGCPGQPAERWLHINELLARLAVGEPAVQLMADVLGQPRDFTVTSFHGRLIFALWRITILLFPARPLDSGAMAAWLGQRAGDVSGVSLYDRLNFRL